MLNFQEIGKRIDEAIDTATKKAEEIYGSAVKNVEEIFSSDEASVWYASKIIGFSKNKNKFVVTGVEDFDPEHVSVSICYKGSISSFHPGCGCGLNKESLLKTVSFIVVKYNDEELVRFSIPDKVALKTQPFIVDKNKIIIEFDVEQKAL